MMTRELEVWLQRSRVGTLSLSHGRLRFAYSTDWLQRPDALALSCSLPLQEEPFDDFAARAFFAGLLPEGRLRRLIAQQFHVSVQNDFALLDHIGGECAGAVTFVEPGQPLPSQHQGSVQWLDDDELAALLDELPRRPMLVGKDDLRLSLAGVQDKLPVIVDGQRIGLPLGGAPSTHILKPAIEGIEDSVSNEGFCMALAEAMGLAVAPARISMVGARRYLLVERYDRLRDGSGQIHRMHQEDFCQALGVVPESKYQNEGGPDMAQCFALLRRVVRPFAPAVLRLFRYTVFHALIGNHDAHAKNFSLLYRSSGPELAPLYDTLSTAIYSDLTPKMAMKLGGKYKFTELYVQHWERLAQDGGLAVPPSLRAVVQMAEQLPVVAMRLLAERADIFGGSDVVARIVRLIEQRAALTIRRLSSAEY
ncbi:type II toxin-antitoxin system HipA family toxin [Cupriavidus sp. JZ107]